MPRWYNDRLRAARAEHRPPPVWDTDDPDRFRTAVASWLKAHAPAKGSPEDFSATHLTAPTSAEDFIEHEMMLFERSKDWQQTLYEAGLASMSWSREHGGQECPAWCDAIVAEEQNHYGVSTRVLSVGLHMMSAVLQTYGSSPSATGTFRPSPAATRSGVNCSPSPTPGRISRTSSRRRHRSTGDGG